MTATLYRPFSLRVHRIEPLSPHFVRVSFTGDDLVNFGRDGLDQRIKIIFPHADGSFGDIGTGDPDREGDWYSAWRALPETERNPFRTYTVRAIDPEARRLTVDFVVHLDAAGTPTGPASAWVAGAQVGDTVLVAGPTRAAEGLSFGIDWKPGAAREVLLVADETAVPAVCAILEALPAGVRAHALCEIPEAGDALEIGAHDGVTVSWLPREGRPHGALLEAELRVWVAANPATIAAATAARTQSVEDIDVDTDILWDSPDAAEHPAGDFYAWIAGEASVIKVLRRLLVTENGVDRHRVAFMGYWRAGRAELQG